MEVGIDIIEVSRLQKISEDEIKMGTIFNESEIRYFNKFSDKLPHIAGHFCAKEAIAKALKTGFNQIVTPLSIEIGHEKNGAPIVSLKGEAKKFFLDFNVEKHNIKISISHCKSTATAICIIE